MMSGFDILILLINVFISLKLNFLLSLSIKKLCCLLKILKLEFSKVLELKVTSLVKKIFPPYFSTDFFSS